MRIDVAFDPEALQLQLRTLRTDIRSGVIVRALNRTLTTVGAEAAREISKDLSPVLKVAQAKKALTFRKATRTTLTARLIAAQKKRIPAGLWRSSQVARGVRSTAPGIRGLILHAFLRKRYGRTAIMIRSVTPKAQTWPIVKPRVGRGSRINPGDGPDYPISEIYVPGVPQSFVRRVLSAKMRSIATRRFAQIVDQELKFRRTTNG
jgi:hypothetical protein